MVRKALGLQDSIVQGIASQAEIWTSNLPQRGKEAEVAEDEFNL
jgi:hypothetical protein